MKFFDKHPGRFRILTFIISIFIFFMIFFTFFKYISSPTDENIFITTPSIISFNKNISAISADSKKKINSHIMIGDLLLVVDNVKVNTLVEALDIIKQSDNKSLNFIIYRPTESRVYSFIVENTVNIQNCFSTIHQTVNITNITENGASDRAGLKRGDLIFKINGQSFKTDIEADIVLRRSYTGKPIVYKLYRNGQITTLHVILARFGVQIFPLMFFFGGLIYILIGIFISMKLPLEKAGRLIGSSFFLIGYFLSLLFIQRDSTNDLFVFIKNTTLNIAILLGISFLIHSILYFPQKRHELIKNKRILIIPYSISILYFIFLILFQNNRFFVIYLSVQGIFIFILLFSKRSYRSREYNKMIKYIKWSYIMLGILSCYSLFVIIFNRFGFLVPVQGLFYLPVPLAYLYTIGRFELYNVDFRIKRNVQYSIAISIWSILVFIIFINILTYLSTLQMEIPNIVLTGSSIEILKTPLSPDKFQYFENSILMIIAIILGFFSLKTASFGKKFIDQKFYRSNYDYKRASNIISGVLATKINALELSKCLVEELAGLMHLKTVGVLFFNDQGGCKCQEIQGYDGNKWNEFCIRSSKKLWRLFDKYPGKLIFDIDDLEDINKDFDNIGFKKIVPAYSKERLMGVLLIGEKLSETLFYPEDTEILTVTAKQSAIAIENILLYEELAEQERMKHELNIARKIQMSTLPQKAPQIKGLDITGISIPARRVGGDYFDYLINGDDKITIIVGDVSGKGISAAFYQSKLQGVFRSLNNFDLTLKDLFIKANTILFNDLELKAFVTAVGSRFVPQKRELTLTRAGHMPIYYYRSKTDMVEAIMPKGLGLGLDNKGRFKDLLEEKKISYNTGDIFLFISDGITEARDIKSNEFGENKLKELLYDMKTDSSLVIKNSIIKHVKEFSVDAEQHDDQTIVVVKIV